MIPSIKHPGMPFTIVLMANADGRHTLFLALCSGHEIYISDISNDGQFASALDGGLGRKRLVHLHVLYHYYSLRPMCFDLCLISDTLISRVSSEVSATPNLKLWICASTRRLKMWAHWRSSMKGRQRTDSEAQTTTASSSVVTALPSSLQWQGSTSSANLHLWVLLVMGNHLMKRMDSKIIEAIFVARWFPNPHYQVTSTAPGPQISTISETFSGFANQQRAPVTEDTDNAPPFDINILPARRGPAQTTRLPLFKLVTELFNFSNTH